MQRVIQGFLGGKGGAGGGTRGSFRSLAFQYVHASKLWERFVYFDKDKLSKAESAVPRTRISSAHKSGRPRRIQASFDARCLASFFVFPSPAAFISLKTTRALNEGGIRLIRS